LPFTLLGNILWLVIRVSLYCGQRV
jgi:hypothetical protein